MVFINLSKRTQDLALKEYKKRRKDLTKNILKNKEKNSYNRFCLITYKKIMDIVRSYL